LALQARERELLELNRQLEDTNAGIVGLLQELDQTSAELRLQAATTTRFLRTVSHELRTPLYAARGLLEELAMADGLDAQARADVKLLDGTVDEALSLVNDQLDLARVEAGRGLGPRGRRPAGPYPRRSGDQAPSAAFSSSSCCVISAGR
jgi:signal transduction histidine kinase